MFEGDPQAWRSFSTGSIEELIGKCGTSCHQWWELQTSPVSDNPKEDGEFWGDKELHARAGESYRSSYLPVLLQSSWVGKDARKREEEIPVRKSTLQGGEVQVQNTVSQRVGRTRHCWGVWQEVQCEPTHGTYEGREYERVLQGCKQSPHDKDQ